MFLSDITEKNVYAGKNDEARGVCRGVGISLKSRAIKYLLCSCSPVPKSPTTDFSVNVSAVLHIDGGIRLSKLRPVFPKNCARIFIGCPVYSYDGAFLGKITDLELENLTATRLFTDNAVYPASAILACADAVILRKEQPFPLGQRIPAPILSSVCDKEETLITKSVLKSAIAKGGLIKLTLSLPPFSFSLSTEKKRWGIFR